jgi:hypothetical protein
MATTEYDAIITPSIELAPLVFLLNIRLSLLNESYAETCRRRGNCEVCAACYDDGRGLLKIPGRDIFLFLREREFFSRF